MNIAAMSSGHDEMQDIFVKELEHMDANEDTRWLFLLNVLKCV